MPLKPQAPKEMNSNNNHVILEADATSTELSDETLTLTLWLQPCESEDTVKLYPDSCSQKLIRFS